MVISHLKGDIRRGRGTTVDRVLRKGLSEQLTPVQAPKNGEEQVSRTIQAEEAASAKAQEARKGVACEGKDREASMARAW